MDNFSICDTTINFHAENVGNIGTMKTISKKYFKEAMKLLSTTGFDVDIDRSVDPILQKDRRYGRKGDLEFKVELYNIGFRITFYQNVNFENSHGGEYDSGKRNKMPYLIGKQFENTLLTLKGFFLAKDIKDCTAPKYNSAEDKIKADYVSAWYKPQKDMDFSLSDVDGETQETYNSTDKNGVILHNGEIKYFRDYNGYLCRGKIYHNINNMWWVITDKKTVRNFASFELFDLTDDVSRKREKPGRIPQSVLNKKKTLEEIKTKELIAELKKR